MEQIQKVVVTGCLIHEGKVLVIQRSEHEKFLPGYYEMPGGKLDFGEEPTAGLAREFNEEVGLKIRVIKPYSTFAYLSNEGSRHTVEILFLVKLAGSAEIGLPNGGHADFAWISESEIDAYKITPEIKEAIRKGFAESKR